VIGFARSVQLLRPLTEDREDLAKALQRVRTRISIGSHFQAIPSDSIDISGALRPAIREFGDRSPEERKRVIVALVDSEDRALAGNLDSLKALLAVSEARLFAVAMAACVTKRRRRGGSNWPAVNQFPHSRQAIKRRHHFDETDLFSEADGRCPSSFPIGTAARHTARCPAPESLRGCESSLPPVAHGELPPGDAEDHGARVCDDDLKLIPDIVDHEEGVNC
jgi:hypothetical protein